MDERSRVYKTAAYRAAGVFAAIAAARVIQLVLDPFPYWVRIPVFAVYGGLIWMLCLARARRVEK